MKYFCMLSSVNHTAKIIDAVPALIAQFIVCIFIDQVWQDTTLAIKSRLARSWHATIINGIQTTDPKQ